MTGNTVIDTFRYTVREDYIRSGPLRALDFNDKKMRYITLTAHRRENQEGNSYGGIAALCRAVKRLTEKYDDIAFIYPVHLSPDVRDIVFRYFLKLTV